MGPGRRRGVLRTGQDLDVQTESTLGLAGQVRQWHARQRAQAPDCLTKSVQTQQSHLRDVGAAGVNPVR